MTTASLEYKLTGIQRLSGYKESFDPSGNPDSAAINEFVNLFCEYQLADNNYMNIHQEATLHQHDIKWYHSLSLDEVLRFITYIIWTDKFLDGYLTSKVTDHTLYHLLSRLETFQSGNSILPATAD
jgi:hypothetical protein